MITTLFFDLGKVLVDFDFTPAFARVAAKSPFAAEHLKNKSYPDFPLIRDYELGRVTTENFFTAMKEHVRFTGTPAELEHIWCDIFTPLEDNLDCVRALAAHYPLAIISNTSDAHIRFLEARHDFFNLFRRRVYSHQIGCLKPAAAIYEFALREMNTPAANALFIDDLDANVAGAVAIGMNAVRLCPGTALRETLRPLNPRGL